MKRLHALMFILAFLSIGIIPESNAYLIKRPEVGSAPYPEYVEWPKVPGAMFPCTARDVFLNKCSVLGSDPWNAASIVKIPVTDPKTKKKGNSYGVVIHARLAGDIVAGTSDTANVKKISWEFSSYQKDGKYRGRVKIYLDGKFFTSRTYPLE